jgi:hypothetical protein
MELVYLPMFIFKSMLFTLLSYIFSNEIFHRFKTKKNTDKKPDLPMDCKPKSEDFCQMFVIAKKKSRTFRKENHRLDLEVKYLWKSIG